MSIPLKEIDDILSKDPENAEAWKIRGDTFLRSTQFYDAGFCFSKAIACDPKYQIAWRQKGLACLFLNDMPDAYDCLMIAIDLNNKDSESWRLMAQILQDKQMIGKVNEYIDKALELNPKDPHTINTKALLMKRQALFDDSISFFEKTIFIDPSNPIALINKSKIIKRAELTHKDKSSRIEKLKNFTVNFLANHFNVDPEDKKDLTKFGDEFFLQFDFETARSCYGKVIDIEPFNLDVLKKQSLVYIKFQDYKQGLAYLSNALNHKNNDSDGWTRMGQLLRIQNKITESIDCFDKALKIDKKNAEAWRHKAYTQQLRHENEEKILPCLEESLKIDPYNPLAYLQKSIFLNRNPGNRENSMWCLNKAIEIHPSYLLAWKLKSQLFSKTHNYEFAKQCYEKILKLDPSDVVSWYQAGVNLAKYTEMKYNQGLDYLLRSDYQKALLCFDDVLEIDTDDVNTLIHRGEVLIKLNKTKEARDSFKLALKLDPQNKDLLSKLKNLKTS